MQTIDNPLTVDNFLLGVSKTALSFGAYIRSHQTRFGWIPKEEGLTDAFSYEYTLAIRVRFFNFLILWCSCLISMLP